MSLTEPTNEVTNNAIWSQNNQFAKNNFPDANDNFGQDRF